MHTKLTTGERKRGLRFLEKGGVQEGLYLICHVLITIKMRLFFLMYLRICYKKKVNDHPKARKSLNRV